VFNRLKPFRHLALWAPLALPLSAPAVTFFDPSQGAPAKLSEVGIYINMTTKELDPALKYFEVNSALWSDAAHKDRWIILPPGKKVAYVDATDKFQYPDSTIFVKLFRHEGTPGDTSSRIYWETRLLVKKSGNNHNWYGFSYKWNKEGNEAFLVSLNNGLDTVVFLNAAPHYRKWHFPKQIDCDQCHRVSDDGRAVLGFFPAQLKRNYKYDPAKNQVTALFDNGVFSGTPPSAAQLGARWRGIGEPIPANISAPERFRVIDTMARAYIAANCSGCHGDRGLADAATGHAPELNYDFHDFTPRMEFGFKPISKPFGLDFTDAELSIGDTLTRPSGRYQFLLTLKEWGINTGSQSNFDMVRPPASVFPTGLDKNPYLLVQGFPAYSTILFRQAARKDPMFDSIETFMEWGASSNAELKLRKKWLFRAKWGSKAWRDTLAAHSVAMSEIFTSSRFEADAGQMPPLATYLPDTAALKILGEWARNYITLKAVPGEQPVLPVNERMARRNGVPAIRNRQLLVPDEWTGKAVMIGLDGRTTPLASVGRSRYALPASMAPGIYFFQVGNRSFRTSVLR
jgi:hypothetical protein